MSKDENHMYSSSLMMQCLLQPVTKIAFIKNFIFTVNMSCICCWLDNHLSLKICIRHKHKSSKRTHQQRFSFFSFFWKGQIVFQYSSHRDIQSITFSPLSLQKATFVFRCAPSNIMQMVAPSNCSVIYTYYILSIG